MSDNILIIVVYISIFFITLLLTKNKYNTIFKINFLYTALWCFCGITSIYNSLNILKPSIKIHIMIYISIIVFNLIYLFFSKKDYQITINICKNVNINKFLYFLNLIAIILIIPHVIQSIKLIMAHGLNLSLIRNEIYVGISNSNSELIQIFTRVIPSCIFSVISIIVAVELVNGNKKNLWLAITNIFLGTLIFGGRNFILNFIFYYVAAWMILKKEEKIKIKKRYIVLTILILWFITYLRNNEVFGFLNTIILYISGSLSFLEYILRNPSAYGLSDGLLYGYMTFAPITEPIVLALKILFGSKIKIPSYYFNAYAQKFVNISETSVRLYNNNTTMFYNFLRDFGTYGFFISIIALVGLIVFCEKKLHKKKDIFYLYALIYVFSVVFASSINYRLSGFSSTIIFILLYLASRNIKKGETLSEGK